MTGDACGSQTTRRSILGAVGTVAVGSIAGCQGSSGGGSVQWEFEQEWGTAYPTGDTLTIATETGNDGSPEGKGATTFRVVDPADGSTQTEQTHSFQAHLASGDGHLHASSGSWLRSLTPDASANWRVSVSEGTRGVVADDSGIGRLDESGMVTWFGTDSGTKRWTQPVSFDVDKVGAVYDYIVLDDDGIVVASSARDERKAQLITLGREGTVRMDAEIPVEDELYEFEVNEDVVALALTSEVLVVADRSSGKILWDERFEIPLSLALSDEMLYVFKSETKTIKALTPRSGTVQWSVTDDAFGYSYGSAGTPAVVTEDDGPVLSAGSATVSFSPDGMEQWRTAENTGQLTLLSDFVVVNGESTFSALSR